MRQEHGAREVAGPDHVNSCDGGVESLRGRVRLYQRQAWCGDRPGHLGLAGVLAVFENDAGFGSAALTHGLQAGFEVALLGPADVADRVIVSGPFVSRVIAARPVAAREADLDFL